MTEVAQLNELLAGSPYSFEDDATSNVRARYVLDQMVKISSRQAEVAASLAAQAAAIKEELERDFDVRIVYESNAIEGVRTSLADTQQLLEANPVTSDFVQAYTFGRQVAVDPKLLEVIGHRARSMAEMLAWGSRWPRTSSSRRAVD